MNGGFSELIRVAQGDILDLDEGVHEVKKLTSVDHPVGFGRKIFFCEYLIHSYFSCESVGLAKLLDGALETGTVDPADSVSGDIICNDIVSQGHFKSFMLNGFTCNIVVFDHVFDRCCRICLLYTSPSPRDVEESRMPSSA